MEYNSIKIMKFMKL